MPALTDLYFDEAYYAKKYPDVRASRMDAHNHYERHGEREGRVPNGGFEIIEEPLRERARGSDNSLKDIVELFPSACRHELTEPTLWLRIKDCLHPALYVKQSGNTEHYEKGRAFDHFIATGAFEGLRICTFFNASWYLEQLERAKQGADAPEALSIEPGVSPFLHWIAIGWDQRIVPTPLFDADYYLTRHPDMARWPDWVFVHYLLHGCYEAARRPSTCIDRFEKPDPRAKTDSRPLLLKHLLDEDAAQTIIGPVDTSVLTGNEAGAAGDSFPLETAAAHVVRKQQKLESPAYRELVAKAAAIEPLVMRPYSPREVGLLPIKHGAVALAAQGEAVRKSIGLETTDIILLVPHCRMAGSARVAGELTRSLRQAFPADHLLLLTTDLDELERPEWFDDGISVFDLSKYAECLDAEKKVRLLLDVVRGLAPRHVFNVNSRLGWDLYRLFGKQLAKSINLFAYLFTWDLDSRGNKGGYPITYFQACFGYLAGVFVDNAVLRDELIWRYAMSSPLQDRLHVAHTPAEPVTTNQSRNFERRRAEGRRLRAFWAGRFDRQKRFDVVIGIAELMPELEIWAWGKEVLGGSGVDFDALPPNIRLLGTYAQFDDLPTESCDFLLYTSEWDGLPTILIDTAIRGIPVVASAVGGVVDLIDDSTGYPVADKLDAADYVRAINEMLDAPREVTTRAQALRAKAESIFNRESHVQLIRASVLSDTGTDDKHVGKQGESRAPREYLRKILS